MLLPRLACIKRTANVRPEPGSNSPSKFFDENDPVSVPKHRPGDFSSLKRMRPCEDESSLCMTLRLYEDGSSMCIAAGLYVHRSFHRSGRSDGHITLTVRSPASGYLAASACQSQSLSCDKDQGTVQLSRSLVPPRTAQDCPQWASQSTTAHWQVAAAGFGRERNCTLPCGVVHFGSELPTSREVAPPAGSAMR